MMNGQDAISSSPAVVEQQIAGLLALTAPNLTSVPALPLNRSQTEHGICDDSRPAIPATARETPAKNETGR